MTQAPGSPCHHPPKLQNVADVFENGKFSDVLREEHEIYDREISKCGSSASDGTGSACG